MEAQEREGKPEHPRGDGAGPGLSERCGEVVALRAVVVDVSCPEEADLMAAAVEPVIAEIFSQ